MTGADKTIDELDEISDQLVGNARDASTFDKAITDLSNQLTSASKATREANAALSAGESQYAQLERAALQAAKAEEKASKAGFIPSDVHAQAVAAASAVNDYASKLKQLEQAAAGAKTSEDALAKTLKNAQTLAQHVAAQDAEAEKNQREQEAGVKRLKGALPALGGALGQVGGQVAGAIDDFGDLTEVFGESGAAAIVATGGVSLLVVALAALVIGAAAGTLAIAAWAVGLSDSNREADLTAQAFYAVNPAIAAVSDTIDELRAATGETTPQLQALAKQLTAAHVSAQDLPDALKAAAYYESALGQGGAADFVAQINAGKKSVKELSQIAATQLGGVVSQRVMGLGEQSAKLKDEIGGIFGDLNIDPVLKGFEKIVGLFDETTASGKTMKFLFESVFQPIIDQADKAATVVEGFIIGFEIGMVKLYIALKPTIKAISDFLGENDPSLSDTLATVTKVGEELAPVVVSLVAGFTVAATVIGLVVGAAAALAAGILALPFILAAAAVALEVEFLKAVSAVYDYLSSIDLGQIGEQLIAGLVAGISSGADAVVKSISSVVQGGIDAAKNLLGIHSPSRVFGDIGDDTVAGFTNSVDDGAGEAQTALTSMVSPDAAAQAAPAAASSAGAQAKQAAGASLNLAGAVFNFYGVKDAENAEQSFGEMLLRLLEGDVAQLGQNPEPASS